MSVPYALWDQAAPRKCRAQTLAPAVSVPVAEEDEDYDASADGGAAAAVLAAAAALAASVAAAAAAAPVGLDDEGEEEGTEEEADRLVRPSLDLACMAVCNQSCTLGANWCVF